MGANNLIGLFVFPAGEYCQGVYNRGLQGNASSSSALEMKGMIAESADTAWRIANRESVNR